MATDQAAEARKRNEEQRAKQEAAEKERAEKEQAERNSAAEKQTAKASTTEGATAEAPPEAPGGTPTMEQLLQRLDAQERLIQTLTAQSAGNTGPAPTDAKDATVASPGAQFDPRIQSSGLAGVTSAPSNQPRPTMGASGGISPQPDGFAAWGYTPAGEKVEAKRYPFLRDEDVLVRRTGYYDDTIRNEGETIRGYTGPAASWFIPVDAAKDDASRKRWDNLFNGRYDEGEAA